MGFLRSSRPSGETRIGQAGEATAEELGRVLADQRNRADEERRHELTRRESDATHRRDLADLGVQTRIDDLAREERVAEALSAARISRTYREAVAAGERMRIDSQMRQSGEARSLTLERLRSLNIKVLTPVLGAFGAWSAAGVQAGAARLMGIGSDSAMWWVLWLLEPALLGAVAWIITARARLASAGGRLEHKAELVGIGCLSTSIVLNVVAALPEHGQPWTSTTTGAMFTHIVGPIGAAVTAYLLGVVDRSITVADPWTLPNGSKAPSLTKMELRPPQVSLVDNALQADFVTAAATSSENSADSGAPAGDEMVAAEAAATPVGSVRRVGRVNGSAQGHKSPAGTSTRGKTGKASVSRSSSTAAEVDRDLLVAELAAEILKSAAAGEKWRPDYEDYEERTGFKRRWCEAVVRDAKDVALRTRERGDDLGSPRRTEDSIADGPDVDVQDIDADESAGDSAQAPPEVSVEEPVRVNGAVLAGVRGGGEW